MLYFDVGSRDLTTEVHSSVALITMLPANAFEPGPPAYGPQEFRAKKLLEQLSAQIARYTRQEQVWRNTIAAWDGEDPFFGDWCHNRSLQARWLRFFLSDLYEGLHASPHASMAVAAAMQTL